MINTIERTKVCNNSMLVLWMTIQNVRRFQKFWTPSLFFLSLCHYSTCVSILEWMFLLCMFVAWCTLCCTIICLVCLDHCSLRVFPTRLLIAVEIEVEFQSPTHIAHTFLISVWCCSAVLQCDRHKGRSSLFVLPLCPFLPVFVHRLAYPIQLQHRQLQQKQQIPYSNKLH